jgi:Flp pilus assembly secretin CpaC
VTLIIGGLIDSKDTRTESGLPVLSDIPVLGRAFRGSASTKTKTELVVFLTPQIIMADGSHFAFPEKPSRVADQALPEVILRDPVPGAYRQTVRRHLEEHLASKFRMDQLPLGSVVVSFVLGRDGRLAGDPDVASPEGEAFVRAATAALLQAQPFPSFPSEAEAERVRFRLAVEYTPQ